MAENALPHPIRFHINHGANVILADNNSVAYRKSSFADAVAMSDRPLLPNEVFLIEIEKTEPGWAGHLRLGLTQVDPCQQNDISMPSYTLPDLSDYGNSWICAITRSGNKVVEEVSSQNGVVGPPSLENGEELNGHDQNSSGCVKKPATLSPFNKYSPLHLPCKKNILATDEGSRIGVVFTPSPVDNGFAEMHFIINGEDQGPFTRSLPYLESPLFAVVDVYGTTKQVRIIDTQTDALTLKSMCRRRIRNSIEGRSVDALPLPCLLKDYLLQSV